MPKISYNNSNITEKMQLPSLTKMPDSMLISQKLNSHAGTRESIPEIPNERTIANLKKRLAAQSEKRDVKLKTVEALDKRITVTEQKIEVEAKRKANIKDDRKAAEVKKQDLLRKMGEELNEISNLENSLLKLEKEIGSMRLFKDVKGKALEELMGDYSTLLGFLGSFTKPDKHINERIVNSNTAYNKKSKFYNENRSNKGLDDLKNKKVVNSPSEHFMTDIKSENVDQEYMMTHRHHFMNQKDDFWTPSSDSYKQHRHRRPWVDMELVSKNSECATQMYKRSFYRQRSKNSDPNDLLNGSAKSVDKSLDFSNFICE